MLLPPPIVVDLRSGGTRPSWAPYVTPAATFRSSDLPIEIGFGTAPPPGIAAGDATAILDLAGRAWMSPACTSLSFRVRPEATIAGDGARDGRNDVLVHAVDWPAMLGAGVLARTVLYVEGDRLVEADIHVNAVEYRFALFPGAGRFDLRSLLTHELGHVAGVGHSADLRATMCAGLPPGIAARSLEADDLAAVCALYPGGHAETPGCGPPCPSGWTCVGFGCERPDEPTVVGAPCDTTGLARRCEGAGDSVRCVATTTGERCAPDCSASEAGPGCGAGLWCAPFAEGSACVPEGAGPSPRDAGSDVGDVRVDGDAGIGIAEPETHGGCAQAKAPPSALGWLLACAVVLASRRRRVARTRR